MNAIAFSMQPDYVERGSSVQRRDLLRWRDKAKRARDEWQKVIDATAELLAEMDKTARRDHEVRTTP